ncbi:M23 family metallopeptidase [Sinomicrobium weinanense]|uniref:M23 family metallopeptidase n=1 Tax=Sinomicrobium weinanense TaxID=2842200 RepID=A0A926Q129_9FLAO|nr:M23 family metallopeptidase [Sinomicrobium weinanense]MBC9795293.1 M23 family metallopeptidase [Sinomicrobium weinanense]MBU3125765.1 peptidoglycan DD-metalloendopeptidase family protein [Sinomicrobium weinanense]
MRLFYIFFIVLTSITVSAQENHPSDSLRDLPSTPLRDHPKDYFRAPLNIPLLLSGTFGELRSNHFHSGTDIKTQQRQGLKAHAAAGGYVSRINVSPWGYGKAVYITHPNGYTSVYAHLQKFAPKIEKYIKERQYLKESYKIELFPASGELPVEKGEVIAYTGNTGGSGGPHLHFEIRDTKTEKPINPLFFGLKVKDSQPPMVQELYAYPLSDSSQVNRSGTPIPISFSRQTDGTLLADKVYASGPIGFGIRAYDRQDLAYNKNGAYAVQMSVNGTAYLYYNFDTFSFAESRYINTLIDYGHYARKRQRIQKCFISPGNVLSIYGQKLHNGIIDIEEGADYNVIIEVNDFEGNKSTVQIPVTGKKENIVHKAEKKTTPYHLKSNRDNIFTIGDVTAFFPANALYEDLYLDLRDNGDGTYEIHNDEVPVHRNFTLSFDVSGYTEKVKQQLFIARLNSRGRPSYSTTYKRKDTFSTHTRNLGTYTLEKDTEAPKITPANFKDGQWLSNYRYLKLKISDDLSGIKTYRATINGKWILMEYEPKTNTLTYNFDDLRFSENKHQLEVKVTDNVENSSTFKATFYRAKSKKQ